MRRIPSLTISALVVTLVVAPAPAVAGGWHGDVSHAATVRSDPTFWFEDGEGHLDREGTLLDGGAVADVGWWATTGPSPLLQVARDVERATWTSDRATRDTPVLRADLLGGVRFAPRRFADAVLVPIAEVLVGVEESGAPDGTPLVALRPAPTAALSSGLLAWRGRTRALAAIRSRYIAYPWVSGAAFVDCGPSPTVDSCLSWGYSPDGATVQVLLGAAFR